MTTGEENQEVQELKSRINHLEGILQLNGLSASAVTAKMEAYRSISSSLEGGKRHCAEYPKSQPGAATQSVRHRFHNVLPLVYQSTNSTTARWNTRVFSHATSTAKTIEDGLPTAEFDKPT